MKFQRRELLVLAITTLLLASCNSGAAPQPTPTLEPSPTPPPSTSTPPPDTPTPPPSPTPLPTEPPQVSDPVAGTIGVEFLNLRAGPSTVHEPIATYAQDTPLTILALAEGGEWAKVQMEDGAEGWMYLEFLRYTPPEYPLPVAIFTNSLVISGRVVDSNGDPIDGIAIAVGQSFGDQFLRTDALSGEDGIFRAYLPQDSSGLWLVEVVGVRCTSRIVDEECRLSGYFIVDDEVPVALPQTVPIEFVYEIATTTISGTVLNAQGRAVVGMSVHASRADGAFSWGISGGEGEFQIAASEGTWQVFTVTFNPRTEGARIEVTVQAGQDPQPIELSAP